MCSPSPARWCVRNVARCTGGGHGRRVEGKSGYGSAGNVASGKAWWGARAKTSTKGMMKWFTTAIPLKSIVAKPLLRSGSGAMHDIRLFAFRRETWFAVYLGNPRWNEITKSFTVLENGLLLAVIALLFALGLVGDGKPYLSVLNKRAYNICHKIIYG